MFGYHFPEPHGTPLLIGKDHGWKCTAALAARPPLPLAEILLNRHVRTGHAGLKTTIQVLLDLCTGLPAFE
ncbi:MAG TPA: hypothetical protein EYQ26_01980 [Rhodospirillales bacterium]|nr:hypothetical protein [Rhodospirillales bacterium]